MCLCPGTCNIIPQWMESQKYYWHNNIFATHTRSFCVEFPKLKWECHVLISICLPKYYNMSPFIGRMVRLITRKMLERSAMELSASFMITYTRELIILGSLDCCHGRRLLTWWHLQHTLEHTSAAVRHDSVLEKAFAHSRIRKTDW